MAELTTEYLDKKLEGLASKADLEQHTTLLKSYVEERTAPLATKEDVHELAGMIERSVNVSERVEKLESDVRAIKQALKLA